MITIILPSLAFPKNILEDVSSISNQFKVQGILVWIERARLRRLRRSPSRQGVRRSDGRADFWRAH